MPYERPPSAGTQPGTKSLDELKVYKPSAATIASIHTIGRRPDGQLESLADVARLAGQDFWRYIDFIFPGCNKTPDCVNWFLSHRYGCPPTVDGKNRRFVGGEKLPLPKLDWKDAKPNDPPPAASRPGFYNRDAATRYAKRWALGSNPTYPETHNGSDCSSFVSQSLLAGGWQMVGEGTVWDYNDPRVWWYGKVTKEEYESLPNDVIDFIKGVVGADLPQSERYRYSQSWAGANNLATFLRLSRRGHERATFKELQPGDVIMEYDRDKGYFSHAMFVVGRKPDDLQYAQHTDNAIRWFSERHPNGRHRQFPNKEFRFFKINDRLN
ncbi:MAG TPA: amidase domain-containing protein [Vineibacter sp.]|nr:amidase domain-containing protein [Vineibacter sp.]